jgi:hypothetical protein
MYVFFETDRMVYQRETKEPYPFLYVKPPQPGKRQAIRTTGEVNVELNREHRTPLWRHTVQFA